MDWKRAEVIKLAVPYGLWVWQDRRKFETLFNRQYKPIATRIDGQLVTDLIEPPARPWRPERYFYGGAINSPTEGYPYRACNDIRAATVLRRCREVLRSWGIDPTEHEAAVAAALREERKANRQRRRWIYVK